MRDTILCILACILVVLRFVLAGEGIRHKSGLLRAGAKSRACGSDPARFGDRMDEQNVHGRKSMPYRI